MHEGHSYDFQFYVDTFPPKHESKLEYEYKNCVEIRKIRSDDIVLVPCCLPYLQNSCLKEYNKKKYEF